MAQYTKVPWNEDLLMLMGASCYLKVPAVMRAQHGKELKKQKPTYRIEQVGDTIELTYIWKTDEKGTIIEDEQGDNED